MDELGRPEEAKRTCPVPGCGMPNPNSPCRWPTIGPEAEKKLKDQGCPCSTSERATGPTPSHLSARIVARPDAPQCFSELADAGGLSDGPRTTRSPHVTQTQRAGHNSPDRRRLDPGWAM